jgi:hypothetical protein
MCLYDFQSVSVYSGHYHPTDENLGSFLAFLKENGVNLDQVQVQNSYTMSFHTSATPGVNSTLTELQLIEHLRPQK